MDGDPIMRNGGMNQGRYYHIEEKDKLYETVESNTSNKDKIDEEEADQVHECI